MLRAIGETLGIKTTPRQPSAPMSHPGEPQPAPAVELSAAERWVDYGFMPGGGGKVETTKYDELPITVREFLVQVKKGKIGRA